MQTQVVTLDVLKPIGTTVDLSDSFNARVGDKMTPFQLFITEGGVAKDLKGMHPELEAEVGNGALRNGVAVMAAGAKGVHWVGSTSNVTGYNQLTLAFPAEVFPQSGFCYGHLILANDAGVRETSVDIWFQVLDGTSLMGLVADHYDSELQLELAKAKNANDQFSQEMRDVYNQQVTDAQNALTRATANLTDLAITAGNISAQIKANDIITRADFKQLDDRVAARLAQIKLSPAAFANLDDLKAKYPNGNDNLNVTVDNGHLIIWFNGEWKDCGQYQTAGLEVEVLKPLKQAIAALLNKVSQHESRLSAHDYVLTNQEQRLNNDDIRIKDNQTRVENIEGVGSLKDIELTDQDGNHLTDNFGVHIGGRRWLINTDKTLTQADLPADAKAVGEALITKPDAYDIPVLYLYGDGIPSLQSKADSLSDGISYSFPRFNISGSLKKIKVQGASSATLAKKNYTLQFDHDVEIFPEYGKQKKYVIKADMTDFSHVRNTGCAQIWGKVRQTRVKADDAIKLNDTDYLVDNSGNHIVGESDPQLSIGGTYGAVDGFPIAVYINDRYWGLYSFNVPKDAWMAKMSSHSEDEAIVSTDWTALDKTIRLDGTDMEIEFCGTKDTAWVFSSINALIDALKTSYTTKEAFDQEIDKHLDVDSAIDYYVYSAAIGNTDGVLRNYLFQTWNRTKWYIAAYDLDMTFGRTPDLSNWLSPVYNGDSNRRGGTTLTNLAEGNRLFHQLWKFHKEDIITRYKELVAGPLSSGAVSTLLTNFAAPIPDALLSQEDKTWPQTRLSGTNNLSQIRWWYMEHINFLTNSIVNA